MFIFSPSEAEKQPRVPKIVSLTRKMTNVMEYMTFFDFAAYTTYMGGLQEPGGARGVRGAGGAKEKLDFQAKFGS